MKTRFLKKLFSPHTQYGHSSLQALETPSASKISFGMKCTALVMASAVEDGLEMRSTEQQWQLLVSHAHSMVLTLYLKTGKTLEELPTTINMVFIFITSRLPVLSSLQLLAYNPAHRPQEKHIS